MAEPIHSISQCLCFLHTPALVRYICLQVHTCPPAMGRSFAAGTTDGPGAFDFEQGT